MTTTLPLTLFLAQAIGLYLVLLGLSGLLSPQRWQRIMDEFAASAALPLVTGVFTFALGAALIHAHSILRDPLAIAVTLVGWAALFKGALLILVPHLSQRMGLLAARCTRIWALFALVLGILLGLAGLLGTADATQFV